MLPTAHSSAGFIPYTGEGFVVQLPSTFIPSHEKEHPGTVLRYEDNYFPVNNVAVLAQPTDKKKIQDYGSPEQFLLDFSYLLGKQAFSGW